MPKVNFEDDELEAEGEQGANLREISIEAGSTIPFGCEQGICGTCLIDVVEGADNLSDMEDNEKETLEAMGAEDGQRLTCQCQLEGDVKIKSGY